jgi:hypothetical protein
VLASKRRFAGYLFSRCDGVGRARREALFDALAGVVASHALGTSPSGRVDALGACVGGGRPRDEARLASRFAPGGFHDGAVGVLAPYKFAVAFEHSPRAPGYVTEKLVNAMLAGAVPIYDGPPEAARWFNPRSYVDCSEAALQPNGSGGVGGSEAWLVQQCVAKVMAVHRNHSAYVEMISEPWLRGGADGTAAATARELFGWHASFGSTAGPSAGDAGTMPPANSFSAAHFASRLGASLRALWMETTDNK